MPNPDLVFRIGNGLATVCWLALLASLPFPGIRRRTWAMTGFGMPSLFALAYIPLLVSAFRDGSGGFGSVAQVRALFANDAGLVAGWLHYLAFDLFVGTWVVRTGLAVGVPRPWLAFCLPLTFLFGPVGLLLFLGLREVHRRRSGLVMAG